MLYQLARPIDLLIVINIPNSPYLDHVAAKYLSISDHARFAVSRRGRPLSLYRSCEPYGKIKCTKIGSRLTAFTGSDDPLIPMLGYRACRIDELAIYIKEHTSECMLLGFASEDSIIVQRGHHEDSIKRRSLCTYHRLQYGMSRNKQQPVNHRLRSSCNSLGPRTVGHDHGLNLRCIVYIVRRKITALSYLL